MRIDDHQVRVGYPVGPVFDGLRAAVYRLAETNDTHLREALLPTAFTHVWVACNHCSAGLLPVAAWQCCHRRAPCRLLLGEHAVQVP